MSSLSKWPAALGLACSLLGGCVSTPPPMVVGNPDFEQHMASLQTHADWRLTGRLAIRQGNESSTVTLDWLQRNDHFDINLRGSLLPLGSTRVAGSDAGLTIERAGEDTVELPNLQALTRDYLNFEFPAANLVHWVRGLPAPGLSGSPTFDNNNLLTQLTQIDDDGHRWTLTYDRYVTVDTLAMPGRIRVATDDLQLTFLVSEWQLSPP